MTKEQPARSPEVATATRAIADGLFADDAGTLRCKWCAATPAYRHYHDNEWGFPVTDDRRLFEKLCLEGFQAGLSWITILNKRENFRAAFANFEAEKIVLFDEADVERLMADAGIVRHRGKIASVINNAQRVIELRKEFGSLASYAWGFESAPGSRPERVTLDVLKTATTSPQSVAMSKDLKKRGWSFVGPTTVYAFMQAMGLVNDHIDGCDAGVKATEARIALRR